MINLKHIMASLLNILGINSLGLRLQNAFLSPYIRAVNYHDVAPSQAEAFEAQLIYFKKKFDVIGPTGLEEVVSGRWDRPRPGLILSFDDGFRSHADVVAPLLERHGLTGWFMVPVGFIDEPPETQAIYARQHKIEHSHRDGTNSRIAMTWEDIRRLSKVHEVGCHSWSHRYLEESLRAEDLEVEISMAKKRLETELRREVQTFAWVGGAESSYSAAASRAISKAGFRFSFMTNNKVIRPGEPLLHLQRTNIEARDPFKLVRFQISGLLDLVYWPKRKRVNRLTRTAV